MNISKNSWHYKWADSLNTVWENDTLCAYVRKVVLSALGWVLLTLSGVVVAFVMSSVFWSTELGAIIPGLFFWAWLFYFIQDCLQHEISWNRVLFNVPIDKECGIVRAWLRDFKDKTCTRITFLEE